MFLMPVTGFFMSRFGGFPINVFNLFTIQPYEKNLELARFLSEIHTITAFAFCGLIGLHIFAALYHHFVLKDNLLTRIIR
jgi:cytochrome b561